MERWFGPPLDGAQTFWLYVVIAFFFAYGFVAGRKSHEWWS